MRRLVLSIYIGLNQNDSSKLLRIVLLLICRPAEAAVTVVPTTAILVTAGAELATYVARTKRIAGLATVARPRRVTVPRRRRVVQRASTRLSCAVPAQPTVKGATSRVSEWLHSCKWQLFDHLLFVRFVVVTQQNLV